MKVVVTKGQNSVIVVRSPGGETFQVVLEPVFTDSLQVPKLQGLSPNDMTGYSSLQAADEQLKEMARVEIGAAAQRLKDRASYGPSTGYNNLNAIENSVGSSNPKISLKHKESGLL